jgi:uncharacterized membrane protein YqhA
MLILLLVILATVFSIGAIRAARLLTSALWLAGVSALVATVFYLISLGLYELFIAKAPLPGWVEIRNLDDLKTKLLGLAVIALVVIFLGAALTMSLSTVNILEFGISIAFMIAAVSAYLWVKH